MFCEQLFVFLSPSLVLAAPPFDIFTFSFLRFSRTQKERNETKKIPNVISSQTAQTINVETIMDVHFELRLIIYTLPLTITITVLIEKAHDHDLTQYNRGFNHTFDKVQLILFYPTSPVCHVIYNLRLLL